MPETKEKLPTVEIKPKNEATEENTESAKPEQAEEEPTDKNIPPENTEGAGENNDSEGTKLANAINSLIISEGGSEISGSGNANLAVLIGGNNNKIIAGTDAYGNVIIGATNTVTSTTKTTTYNRILGNNNTITDAQYNNILGYYNNITASGAYEAYNNNVIGYYNTFLTTNSTAGYNFIAGTQSTIDGGNFSNIIGRYGNNGGYSGVLILADGNTSTMTANASNQFNARFYGGYRFMQNGTTQWMAIANTGYVTINNIPTAASATDILVSNGGEVSTRTVASLGIPVITPSALTKTDDTNVTLTLGGTPATALLEAVSLTLGWTGILAITLLLSIISLKETKEMAEKETKFNRSGLQYEGK